MSLWVEHHCPECPTTVTGPDTEEIICMNHGRTYPVMRPLQKNILRRVQVEKVMQAVRKLA